MLRALAKKKRNDPSTSTAVLDWFNLIEQGELAKLKTFLITHKNFNIEHLQADDKKSALIIAADLGHHEIVDALIERDAACDRQCQQNGYTALMYAVARGHEACADILVDKTQSNLHLADRYGNNVMHIVARFSAKPRIARKLLEKDKSLAHSKGEKSYSVMHMLVVNADKTETDVNLNADVKVEQLKAVNDCAMVLFEFECSMDSFDDYGKKPTDYPGYQHIKETIIKCKKNKAQQTQLSEYDIQAVQQGKNQVIYDRVNTFVISWVSADNDGNTLMHLAIDGKNTSFLTYLLTQLADANVLIKVANSKNKQNESPIDLAMRKSDIEVWRVLYTFLEDKKKQLAVKNSRRLAVEFERVYLLTRSIIEGTQESHPIVAHDELLAEIKLFLQEDVIGQERKNLEYFIKHKKGDQARALYSLLSPLLEKIKAPESHINIKHDLQGKPVLKDKYLQDDSLFAPLRKLIQEIEKVIENPLIGDEEPVMSPSGSFDTDNPLSEIDDVPGGFSLKNSLCAIADQYQLFINQFCQANDRANWLQMISSKYTLHGTGLPVGQLVPQAVAKLIYQAPQGKSDEECGHHMLQKLGGLHWKLKPDKPGYEILVGYFNKKLAKVGTPPTLLVKISGSKNYPYLVSRTVEGLRLDHVIEFFPEYLQKLDHRNFSELVVLFLMVQICDGKPDNFLVELNQYQGDVQARLFAIDNGYAFRQTNITQDTRQNLESTNIRNILFLFSQMNIPIDQSFHQSLVNDLSPEQLMIDWLAFAYKRDCEYRNMLKNKIFTEADFSGDPKIKLTNPHEKGLELPIRFVPGFVAQMYQKLKKLKGFLVKNSERPRLNELFQLLEPELYDYYKKIKKSNQGDVAYLFACVNSLYKPQAPQCPKEQNNVIKAAEEFLMAIDYSDFSDAGTLDLLFNQLLSSLYFIRALTIINYQAFNSNQMAAIKEKLRLKRLSLYGCPNVGYSDIEMLYRTGSLTELWIDEYCSKIGPKEWGMIVKNLKLKHFGLIMNGHSYDFMDPVNDPQTLLLAYINQRMESVLLFNYIIMSLKDQKNPDFTMQHAEEHLAMPEPPLSNMKALLVILKEINQSSKPPFPLARAASHDCLLRHQSQPLLRIKKTNQQVKSERATSFFRPKN